MMKLPSRYKSASVVALLALGISSQASAFPLFTVDPNAAFGAQVGLHQGPFTGRLHHR